MHLRRPFGIPFVLVRTVGLAAIASTAVTGCSADTSPEEAPSSSTTSALATSAPDDGRLAGPAPSDTVTVTGGRVRGTVANGVGTYLGIPFAESPEGARRWRAPVPRAPWAGVLEAKSQPNACPQLLDDTSDGAAPGATVFVGKEDCLHLNVWSPGGTDRPVMVFLHGGGFRRGSATYGMPELPLYDGEALARATGHVVVVAQYRVGTLGFLGHPGVADGSIVGNFGLLDQRLALRWVKDNAKAFGGTPSNVTIFGESAGAMSVCAHMASPGSRGLFHRAIMQSGWCPAVTREFAASVGATVTAAAGCDPKAPADTVRRCLEAVTPERLTRAMPKDDGPRLPVVQSYGPVIDGTVLLESPERTLARGPEVPLIVGYNREDMPALVFENTRDAWKSVIAGITPPGERWRVEAAYSPLAYGSYANALGALGTDTTFGCATRRIARTFSKPNGPRAYRYVFPFPSVAPIPAFHGIELVFLFQHGSSLGPLLANPTVERNLATAWGSFASKGVPSLPGFTTWMPTSSLFEPTMQLATNPAPLYGYRNAECDLLERAGVTMN